MKTLYTAKLPHQITSELIEASTIEEARALYEHAHSLTWQEQAQLLVRELV